MPAQSVPVGFHDELLPIMVDRIDAKTVLEKVLMDPIVSEAILTHF